MTYPGIVEWRVAQLVEKGVGSQDDYAFTWMHTHSALVRVANRERVERTAKVNESNVVTKKGKTAAASWIRLKPGTPFFVHVDDERNRHDRFVQEFIENPLVTEDKPFMTMVNSWPVS